MLWLLLLIFAVSRAVLYTIFPFRIEFLPWLMQLLDVELLKYDLWSSLWYLHTTPPLYNLMVGLMLKAFPTNVLPYAFQTLYFLMGLGMVAMTYLILKYLTKDARIACVGGLIFTVYPVLFSFEVIPFYTYPLAFLLVLTVYALTRFVDSGKRLWLVTLLITPVVMILMRNFFHIVFYFIPIAFGVCWYVYKTRRPLFGLAVAVSIVLFVIGLAPSIKNQVQYGIFSSSTWQGMQLYSLTYFVPHEKIDVLKSEGLVTPIVDIPRFRDPEIYYHYYGLESKRGTPAVNALRKSTGDGNFNNWIYARVAKESQKNALTIIARYPQYLVERYLNSVYIFFGVGNSNYRFFNALDKWLVFDGSTFHRAYQWAKYFIVPAVFGILFFFILWRLWKDRRNVVSLLLLFILLYVFGVSTVVEIGENYTARAPADPLIIISAVYTITALKHRNTQTESTVLYHRG